MSLSHPPPILLLDGGLGTTLADQHACTFDARTPLWSSHLLLSSSTAALLLATHAAFAHAGADVILSATYQASFEGFARTGPGISAHAAAALMRRGVRLAREAFGEARPAGTVALSLGAYGAVMVPSQEYSGRYDEARMSVAGLQAWHLRRLRAFMPAAGPEGDEEERDEGDEEERAGSWAEVDLVAFETLPRVQEIEAVRRVMATCERGSEPGKGPEGRPFWITCVFPGEGNCLPDGSGVRATVRAMLEPDPARALPMAVGVNCTPVAKLESLVLEFESEVAAMVEAGDAEWPSLVLYPDGTHGEVYDTTTKQWLKPATEAESVVSGLCGGVGKEPWLTDDGQEVSWGDAIWGIVQRARGRALWRSILVGGCCKTTPEDIARLRQRIDAASSSSLCVPPRL